MAVLERQSARSLASEPAGRANLADDAHTETQTENRLEDALFSELITSVCYWSTVFLLALVGAGLLYWRLGHPASAAAPISDPFGVTTPAWMMVSLPPIGVAASLGHATWCAVRRRRVWGMLMTAASLVAVMSVTAR
jgi:hypothetical protein